MPRAKKAAAQPETTPIPQVGDKVIPERSTATWVITEVRSGSNYVDLELPGTNLDRFHVDVTTLKFVERTAPKPARPEHNTADIGDRVATIQRESLERLDDDIAILTKYLKTEGAPKAAIDTLEALGSDQHDAWDSAVAASQNCSMNRDSRPSDRLFGLENSMDTRIQIKLTGLIGDIAGGRSEFHKGLDTSYPPNEEIAEKVSAILDKALNDLKAIKGKN